MRYGLRRLIGLAATSLLVIGWGCGGGGTPSVDTSTTEATVKGTVKIRGKLASGGKVSFNPANVKRKHEMPRLAAINKDGTYTVTTLEGLNMITFSGPAFAKDRELQDAALQYDVQPGEQVYDIEVPPPANP